MFSRSEKTEEVIDPMAEPSGERSPMVLAAIAGLLAIAGAFLLVWYLNNGQDDVAVSDPDGTSSTSAAGGSSASAEADKQVLVVVETIPRDTSVAELIEAPTVYLSARAVPEEFVAASAITSVAELRELEGLVLASDALPGEQLLRGRFRDPNDFDSGAETVLEAQSIVDPPEGHHAIQLELPARRALGGLIGPGERVTVIGGFRISPPEQDTVEVSLVVLNAVEVIAIQESLTVQGQLSSDLGSTGAASRGSFTITVAVKPEELTDLTYAMTYGEITLATAVQGLDEDGPRAITAMNQLVGDDGVWLTELDDGNLVDLISAFQVEAPGAQGESIELDLPTADDESDGNPATGDDTNDTELVDESDAAGDS